jgi:hypothetical protein
VGASGIKRRKPKRKLPEPHVDMTPGDQRRAFGQFTWGSFSPAGAMEREGFFWRQVTRARRLEPGWRRNLGYALASVIMVIGAIYVLTIVGSLLLHVFGH